MFQLHIDAAMYRVYQDLPDRPRARVAQVLVDALADPRQIGEPYGDVDDGLMRLWAGADLAVVLLIGEQAKKVLVLSTTYAGLE
ncbi:hypothetical protein EDD99_5467 [Streptomyces sp. 846.5]|nr:hypothetical protein [Streptomyces sp. 846.5]TDT97342.1 hypothetical protein EDD99_5467 [Streptomyces sp. 846.5]